MLSITVRSTPGQATNTPKRYTASIASVNNTRLRSSGSLKIFMMTPIGVPSLPGCGADLTALGRAPPATLYLKLASAAPAHAGSYDPGGSSEP